MNFSAWSIRNPIAPVLAFFILMVLGWQSFNALPITRFPNIDFPLVVVNVAQPGAAPTPRCGALRRTGGQRAGAVAPASAPAWLFPGAAAA